VAVLRSARQREGIAKAKSEGKYKGRKPTARAKAEEFIARRGRQCDGDGQEAGRRTHQRLPRSAERSYAGLTCSSSHAAHLVARQAEPESMLPNRT